ncbi:hypothetical protein AVEN_256260-1 [Araneus ventricosus]|uniref:Uncharacterized protein n=1 Tax=Araneus ventricosus TaxID=182803 RepID=A0A4Y2S9D7_ARAVE|nr:hypothetical protein AVEN_256260-1 [Araneus ventricosus]
MAALIKQEFLQKGIKTINSREHQEKLNLWKALMIMEAEFGSKEGLLAIFEEALKHNNKRDFCLQIMCLWINTEKKGVRNLLN